MLSTWSPQMSVQRAFPDGSITTLWQGYGADLAVLPDGRILATDMNRIVQIGQGGDARPFAGTGEIGFSGDGGPATEARLSSPDGVAAMPDGSALIADAANGRVRRVDTRGVISTAAQVSSPIDVADAPDGGFYVADMGGRSGRILHYSADGTLLHAYPTLSFGRPDSGSLRPRQIPWRPLYPRRLAVLPDGNIAFVTNSELWLLALAPVERLAVSLRNVATLSGGVVTATIASTAAGTASLSVRGSSGRVSITAPIAQGVNELSFTGRFASGWRVLRVEVTDAAGRTAGDRIYVWLGPRLTMDGARGVLGWMFDELGEDYEFRRCQRVSSRRVDCVIHSYEFSRPWCWRVAAVTLPSSGIPSPRLYRCKKGNSPFRKHPWSN